MKKKLLKMESISEFQDSIDSLPKDSKIFIDKSLEIANYIHHTMELLGMKQKDLATLMEKSEAEVSKLLSGMHNYTLRSLSKVEAALGTSIICVPRIDRSFLAVMKTQKSNYEVTEKREKIEPTTIRYTNVIQMFKTVPEEEAMAL